MNKTPIFVEGTQNMKQKTKKKVKDHDTDDL